MAEDIYKLPRSDKFIVEIDGIDQGSWQSISGITNEVNVVETTVANKGLQLTQKRPGLRSYGEFTVTRTFDGSDFFQKWWDQVRLGEGTYKKTGSIKLLEDDGSTPVAEFKFQGAFIKSYNLSDLGASTDAVVTESFTIVHEGLDPQ